MNDRELVLSVLREQGRQAAARIRRQAGAGELTDDQLLSMEGSIPDFDPGKDYSGWPVGAPVRDGEQVYGLLQPHNAAHFEGRPETLRALWSLKHAKNPRLAKPWVPSQGTSGMYGKGECCLGADGRVYISLLENNSFSPEEWPDGWQDWEGNPPLTVGEEAGQEGGEDA